MAYSPPTSPAVSQTCSPPTSPPAPGISPSSSPQRSPPTSPAHTSDSSHSSDLQPSKPKIKRSKLSVPGASRSTLERRLFGHRNVDDHTDTDRSDTIVEAEILDHEFTGNCDNYNSSSAGEENLDMEVVADDEADSSSSESEGGMGSINEDELAESDNESETAGMIHGLNEFELNSDSDTVVSSDSDFDCNASSGESNCRLLFENAHITRDECILKVLKLYIQNRWTKASLNRTIKTFKEMLPQPNDMPPSDIMLFKRLEEVAPFHLETEHYYCSECQLSITADTEECPDCNCKEKGIFFEYPIGPQLKYMFEHRSMHSLIDRHKKRLCTPGSISDIQDGTEYKKVRSKLTGDYDIVLKTNSDGVSLSKSSKQELWAVLSEICEIPPELRSSYMILSGVYVGPKKPKMNTFLKPFVNALQDICNSGGLKWTHPETNAEMSSHVESPIVCADAPAKAIMLNVKLFSHRYGCNVCEQRAKVVPLTQEEVEANQGRAPRRRKRPQRRFVFQENPASLRTGPRMQLQGELAEERQKSRKGVIGNTVLCELYCFDRACCICAEYLHLICLGAVKYFLILMFCVRGPWYIGDKQKEIDEFLLSAVKVPDFIKRVPRGISDLKFMIGSELRAFLLFYLLPACKEHLPTRYFDHWMLLVNAIFIFLKDSISENELNSADRMLQLFVRDIHELYQDKYYTYNIHNLLHIRLLVERWGPLWATGAFNFEKFNGFIVAHVHGTKHIGRELLNVIQVIQSVVVFEKAIKVPGFLKKPDAPAVLACGKPLSISVLSNDEKDAILNAEIHCYKIFSRVKVNGEAYSSRHYDQGKKRSNSLVQFVRIPEHSEPEHGEILFLIEDSRNSSVLCLLHVFKIVHTKIIFHSESRMQVRHLLPVNYSGELLVLPVGYITTKVIKAGEYLCQRPNKYEVNL